jgi:Flp pilus assembly protein CpaB
MRRRSPRAVLLWIGAVIVAIVTAVVVATDLAALHRRARGLGPQRPIAVAVRDLPVGTTIRDGDIRVRSVHRSQLPADAMSPAAARGRVVAVPVVRGAFVIDGNVAPRRRTGLNGAITTGMRAMQIVVWDALRPPVGSSVDVLVTFDPGSNSASSAAPTVVAARGVLVLGTGDAPAVSDSGATGRRTGSGQSSALGVTLLVSQEDAPRLAFAAATGVVTIALVPPEDATPVIAR